MRKGQIVKRGKKTYQIRIPLGRDSVTKTRRYFTKTLHCTAVEAENFLNRKILEIEQGEYIKPLPIALDSLIKEWLEGVKVNNAQATYDFYIGTTNYYILPYLGKSLIENITPKDVESLYKRLKESALSSSTIASTHRTLITIFRFAISRKYIGKSPMDEVRTPKLHRRRYTVLSPQSAAIFVQAAEKNKHGLLFLFALITGMRPSEYAGLQWSDIDFENATVSLHRNLVYRTAKGWYFSKLKNESSRRTIPLPISLIERLRQHKERQAQWYKDNPDKENHGFIFTSRKGSPVLCRCLGIRHLKPLLRSVNLPDDMRLYDLRHSCATILLAMGEDPRTIADRLGHTLVSTTLNTYAHSVPGKQKQATTIIEKALFPAPGNQTAHIEGGEKETRAR